MIVKYECQFCRKQYEDKEQCEKCEGSHLQGNDKIIYDLKRKGKNPCNFCKNQYLVYGCEADCSHIKCQKSHRYIDFELN